MALTSPTDFWRTGFGKELVGFDVLGAARIVATTVRPQAI